MNTSTNFLNISITNFIAQLHPTTAFIKACEKILKLAEQDESFKNNINKIKQKISQSSIHPFTLTLIEDALAKGETIDLNGTLMPLIPLVGTLYLQTASKLQSIEFPSDEYIKKKIKDPKKLRFLDSILEDGILMDLDLYASRLYRSVVPFQREIEAAIDDLKLVSSIFDRQAKKFNELLNNSDSDPQKAKCIFNGKEIPCSLFWILVVAITLAALILEIFDDLF